MSQNETFDIKSMAECIKNLSVSKLQDRSIEFGWDFINRAVCKKQAG